MPNVEEHLRRAIEEGKFDHLPGKGQPLNWEENPWVKEEWRLAFHLLRENGFTLSWIEMRQEIEAELNAARHLLKQAWDWRNKASVEGDTGSHVQANWQRATQLFRQEVEALNRKIAEYNLQVPLMRFQLRRIDLSAELEALKASDANPRHASA